MIENRHLEITATPEISATHAQMSALLSAVDGMRAKVPLQNVILAFDTDHYNYSIKAADGREWHQKLYFGTPVTMTFDITDQWALSESAAQQPIRDLLILLVQSYGMTAFKVTFAPA